MRYWCSRPHDWEGVLTTANHDKQVIDEGPTVETEEEALAESEEEVVEEPEDDENEYFSEEGSAQSENSEMAEMEKEAKIARDSSDSEGEDATEFLAAGQDLDLPSEDSGDEDLDEG